jgi:Fe2+ or Zn2+ uptake regulation protein
MVHSANDRRARVARFEQLCRKRGLALTIQRRAIFAEIAARRDHPTADDVFAALHARLPGISRATVYRVVETLVRAGAIAKACHPGAAARYDPLTERHHHLVCLECGHMQDLSDPQLDALPLPRVADAGFEIRDYTVHFRGLCAACRLKPGLAQTRAGPRRPAEPRKSDRADAARILARRKNR